MTPEDLWRGKTDNELFAAADQLGDYTEEGQRIVLAEIERRKTPEYKAAKEAADRQLAEQQAREAEIDQEARRIAWRMYMRVAALFLVLGATAILLFAPGSSRVDILFGFLLLYVVGVFLSSWSARRGRWVDLLFELLLAVARRHVRKRAQASRAA